MNNLHTISYVSYNNAAKIVSSLNDKLPLEMYVLSYNDMASDIECGEPVNSFGSREEAISRLKDLATQIICLGDSEANDTKKRIENIQTKASALLDRTMPRNFVKINGKTFRLSQVLSAKKFKDIQEVTVKYIPTVGYFTKEWFDSKGIKLVVDSKLKL